MLFGQLFRDENSFESSLRYLGRDARKWYLIRSGYQQEKIEIRDPRGGVEPEGGIPLHQTTSQED